MKRIDIIAQLIKEGFSDKTLANLSDKQLEMLSDRVLIEQVAEPVINVSKTDVNTQNQLRTQKKPFATYETEMKEEDTEEKPKFKSKTEWLKSKGIIKDDDDDKEKKKEETKESIAPASQPVAIRGDAGVDLTEWVKNIVGKNIHPFTSKSDIMGLIESNLAEQEAEVAEPPVDTEALPEWLTYDAIHAAGAAEPAEPKTRPTTKPGKPDQRPRPDNPYQPGPGINPAPKAEKTR